MASNNKIRSKKSGFSLVELLVAIAIMGVIGLVAGGLIIPLSLTRSTNRETQSVSFARSYIELVKIRWLDRSAFTNAAQANEYNLPSADSTAGSDIILPPGWILETNKADWKITDTIRTIQVILKPSSETKTWITLTTQIASPTLN